MSNSNVLELCLGVQNPISVVLVHKFNHIAYLEEPHCYWKTLTLVFGIRCLVVSLSLYYLLIVAAVYTVKPVNVNGESEIN